MEFGVKEINNQRIGDRKPIMASLKMVLPFFVEFSRGHTDNDQAYDPTPYDPAASIRCAARIALSLIELHAARWEYGEDERVGRATAALDVLITWLGQPASGR